MEMVKLGTILGVRRKLEWTCLSRVLRDANEISITFSTGMLRYRKPFALRRAGLAGNFIIQDDSRSFPKGFARNKIGEPRVVARNRSRRRVRTPECGQIPSDLNWRYSQCLTSSLKTSSKIAQLIDDPIDITFRRRVVVYTFHVFYINPTYAFHISRRETCAIKYLIS